MTSYNILKIPNKFARDDRSEKVARLYSDSRYDTILFGSSRVYVTNPRTVSIYLGGRTYNAGVGKALIEDQLGFMLFLQRIGKLPKNALFGLDFYSFNQNVQTDKYFLKNADLNFMNKKLSINTYFEKFFSIDATRASYKTLYNFLVKSIDRPRFDSNGAARGISTVFDTSITNKYSTKFSPLLIAQDKHKIQNLRYTHISQQRLNYLKKIVSICRENNMKCIFFTTPLNGQMLDEFTKNRQQQQTLLKFKKEVASITPFYDFLYHNQIIDNRNYFLDTMHFLPQAGNLLYAKIFHDKNITIPKKFGVYTTIKTKVDFK